MARDITPNQSSVFVSESLARWNLPSPETYALQNAESSHFYITEKVWHKISETRHVAKLSHFRSLISICTKTSSFFFNRIATTSKTAPSCGLLPLLWVANIIFFLVTSQGFYQQERLALILLSPPSPAVSCYSSDVRGQRSVYQSFLKCQRLRNIFAWPVEAETRPVVIFLPFRAGLLCLIWHPDIKRAVILWTCYIRMVISVRSCSSDDPSEFAAWGWWYLKLMSVTFETVPSSIMTTMAVSLPLMFSTSLHWYLTAVNAL